MGRMLQGGLSMPMLASASARVVLAVHMAERDVPPSREQRCQACFRRRAQLHKIKCFALRPSDNLVAHRHAVAVDAQCGGVPHLLERHVVARRQGIGHREGVRRGRPWGVSVKSVDVRQPKKKRDVLGDVVGGRVRDEGAGRPRPGRRPGTAPPQPRRGPRPCRFHATRHRPLAPDQRPGWVAGYVERVYTPRAPAGPTLGVCTPPLYPAQGGRTSCTPALGTSP